MTALPNTLNPTRDMSTPTEDIMLLPHPDDILLLHNAHGRDLMSQFRPTRRRPATGERDHSQRRRRTWIRSAAFVTEGGESRPAN